MERYQNLLGCLLGTALGDAVGLRREGLSRRRATRIYGGAPLTPNLVMGRGFCSDDTEHTQMVGRALVASGDDMVRFERELSLTDPDRAPIDFLSATLEQLKGNELREQIQAAVNALSENKTPVEFAQMQGWTSGVSGYINHTVPAALYCWANSSTDFRQCVEDTVLMGGDSDSVAAIAGAVCGANLGSAHLPADWLDCLAEWPRDVRWMHSLAHSLSMSYQNRQPATGPSMHWASTMLRNVVFASAVLCLGLRRLLPPY